MVLPETIPQREYLKFRESVSQPGKTVVAVTADDPIPVSVDNVTIENANLFVQLTHEDDSPNPGDIHDSVRVGDGTTELAITPSKEAKVSDATTHTTLSSIESDTTSIDSKLNTLGQKTMATSVPVVLPSDQIVPVSQSGTWNVGLNAGSNLIGSVNQGTSPWITDSSATTQPISAVSLPLPTGASTSSNQVTANASLASIDSKLTAPISVTGPLTDSQLRATPVPVSASQSGTWDINNINGTVSLPTGASTAARQDTGNSSLSSIDGKLVNNYGVATGALRTASQIGNATGAADFNSGNATAQTQRVVIATDQSAIPTEEKGFGTISIDATISVTNTSTQLLAANSSRKHASFTNNGGSTVYLAFGAAAVFGRRIPLAVGAVYFINKLNLWTGSVNAIKTGGGSVAVDVFEATL